MRQVHELAIHRQYELDGFTTFEVDTQRARYFGKPWKSLGTFGRRKFENWIFLNNGAGKLPKFIYRP